eukprot:1614594-Rhodomonas_salina.1
MHFYLSAPTNLDLSASMNHYLCAPMNHYLCASKNHYLCAPKNHYLCAPMNHDLCAPKNHCLCALMNLTTYLPAGRFEEFPSTLTKSGSGNSLGQYRTSHTECDVRYCSSSWASTADCVLHSTIACSIALGSACPTYSLCHVQY